MAQSSGAVPTAWKECARKQRHERGARVPKLDLSDRGAFS